MTELRRLHIEGVVSGETAKVTNGGLDVNIQDQHSRALDLKFIMATGAPTALTSPTAVDDLTISVADVTGFIDGTYVGVFDPGGAFYFGTQLGATVGNVITLDSPLDNVFSVGSSVIHATANLAVDGSTTSKIFQIGPVGGDVEIDITRILGYMQDGTVMEDSGFGGIAGGLTQGCVLRVSNGVKQNLWNVKTNGDLALIGYDFTYTEKAPAGSYGARFRITYAGQDKHGVTLRLGSGDTLEFIVQDNLAALEVFNIMAQGHQVE